MKRIIQFHVSKGEKYYIAEGIDLPIVTQGLTLDELAKNVEEAVSLHLSDEDFNEFNIDANPSVLMTFELPNFNHAQA